MEVIFVRGIQGSGKSTYAKNWVLEKPETRIRINWDDMRNMLGKYWVPVGNRENLIKDTSYFILSNSLDLGFSVIIDNMNLSNHSTRDFIKIAESKGATIKWVDFKTPLEECIARDNQRENPIGEAVIRATYERYKSFYN